MSFERGGQLGYRELENGPPDYFYFGGPDLSVKIQYAHPIFRMDVTSANPHPLSRRERLITPSFSLAQIDITPPTNKILASIPPFVAKDIFISMSPQLLTLGCELENNILLPIIETPEFPHGNMSITVTTDFNHSEASLPPSVIVPKPAEEVRAALGLTLRELEIVRLIAQGGYTNDQLGEILGISKDTASKHVSNALGNMKAANRTIAAVRVALLGLNINEPVERGRS